MTDPSSRPAFRCSGASRACAEPQEGTASTVRAFLLLEAPGPWGEDALRDSRLPEPVRRHLAALEGATGVRPLLLRRPGRRVAGPTRLFAATTAGPRPACGTALLSDPHELLDLDLSGLRDGALGGLERHEDPLVLVCTHGRHDACCAERGRPLAGALAGLAPAQTWEVSHIGGDRFAANVLVLPEGLYYGRVEVADAADLAAAVRTGRVLLPRLRGRSSYPLPVQAAEVHLRRLLDEDRAGAVRLVGADRRPPRTTARFDVDGTSWQVLVETARAPAARLTCRATRDNEPPTHRIADVRRVA